MRVLSWNLFHGRALPPARRELLAEFAAAIAGWDWDVALLQEVPPWWPPALAVAAGAQQRTALTSRNAGLPVRRWIARRRPDVIRSNGGGANAILVRGVAITEHRVARLRRRPERRVVHAARLASGPWVANTHAQVHSEERAQADIAAAAYALDEWSAGGPRVLGGDLNVRVPRAVGLAHMAGHRVDHVLADGFVAAAQAVPDSGVLSDHAPLLVSLREGSASPRRQDPS